eukprot:COSAG04_NODE_1658_length_6031_cov_2.111823_2_plen_40_part_00
MMLGCAVPQDIALLEDGKTLVCVIRMDGDSGCATKSYRY